MGKVIRPFCWHQNFVPKGLSAPTLGLYTCIKSWKNVYKIRLQRDVFETCNKWAKWESLSVDIKFLSPGVCLPLPLGYIHVYKHEKIGIKSGLQRDFLWPRLASKFCPQGVVCPCPGAILKHENIRIKSDFKEIYSTLATNGHSYKAFLST